ncbi:hypothetical protein M9H77_02891 [Catharanthus roseus]|uniref:Uncharacterized protein n=1 Tax=Catharanthus roseus TaxID=4058 RepID=A0ACC0CA41_CATRO|nr:hypothetical protein M9H77_02891 [Catharanthus roseus]
MPYSACHEHFNRRVVPLRLLMVKANTLPEPARWQTQCVLSTFLFQSKHSMQIAPVPPLRLLLGGDNPHLHRHSMEELLLNSHYNKKKKFSRSIYDAKPRSR